MSIHFHDPRGASRVAAQAYICRSALHGAPMIGLLANNFPDSVEFLNAIERAISTTLPAARFARYVKPSASAPADDDLVSRIVDECEALVTAYGH
ncbi:MAG: hypothetical protein WD928_09290 [Gammaproteobacteria bacterium]